MDKCLQQYQPLTLAHRELLQRYVAKTDYRLSRYNFINLWMYSKWIPIYYYLHDDILLLISYYKRHYFSYMPLCDKDKLMQAYELVERIFAQCNLPFIYACFEEEEANLIMQRHPDFEKKPYRDSFDYIYDIERFRNFSGKKLQKKRNHLNAFYSLYPDFVYEPLTQDNLPAVKEFTKDWYKKHQGNLLEHDEKGNYEVLDNYFALDAHGGCILIKGQIAAFIIASWQNPQTMQVNIEKANEEYRGIYQAILREFLQRNFQEAVYMNREDDLGLENLRKAKKSYYPELILENYRICEKDHHVDYES